jgi:protein-S-isoprenylcysteine O-methyltransferase Ste14
MPVRFTVIALSVGFAITALFYRIRSVRKGERLDRTKEGWGLLIGLRLAGVSFLVSTVVLLSNPTRFPAAQFPVPEAVRWMGVAGLACAVAWLLWMFHSLGRNLTDTVVTRRDATFVNHGPYRFVRNPMYTGVLAMALTLGVALGTWLVPLLGALSFALLARRTKTEEKYLIEKFGDQYRDYMTRVGRFLPKLRSGARGKSTGAG